MRSIRFMLGLSFAALSLVGAPRRADAQDTVGTHRGTVALFAQAATTAPMSDSAFVRMHIVPAGFGWVPESTLVRSLRVLRERTGGIRVVSSERRGASTWYRVEPLRGRGAGWVEVFTNGDRIMPWVIRIDHFALTGAPPALPDSAVPPDSVLPIVDRWLGWWERNDRWSGTVGIARRDETVMLRPLGLADRTKRVPNVPDTRYHLGSMNKTLTAVALLQQVQAGRVQLDDPIARCLPDYPKPELAAKITIRQLLTHTAGLGGLFELPGYERNRRYGSNAAYLPLFADRALMFEPGARYSYSNEGFLLAGAILERITGQSYDAYLAEHILTPSGMTGWCDCMGRPDTPRRAYGYSAREDQDPLGLDEPTDNEYFLGAEGLAAGGYYATAEDFLRFAAAMRRGVLLDSAHQALFFTRAPQTPPRQGYGLGVDLVFFADKAAWGHDGGGGRSGIGSFFSTFADGSWTVAAMGNRDLYLTREVLRPLMTFLARQP